MMIKKFLAKLLLQYIFRGKTIFFVSGMRRSGNHAFVNWLCNALEEKATNLKKDHSGYFYCSYSGKTIFFDEVNKIKGRDYIEVIWKNRSQIKQCKVLIISVEDCPADYENFRIPRFTKAFFIKRSILNLIASRLKGLINKAAKGNAFADFEVNTLLLKKIKTFGFSDQYMVWDFDHWLKSPAYRSKFLSLLNLATDIVPDMSSQGGGSSFSSENEIPKSFSLNHRYEQIEFPDEIISLFSNKRFRKLLSPVELQYLVDNYDLDVEK